MSHLFVLYVGVVQPETFPRERGLAYRTVAVFHIVQAETGKGFHIAVNGNVLPQFVLLLRLFESHLEGGTFVFLYTERVARPVFLCCKKKFTVHPVGGNDERAAERAVFVGGERCGGYSLVIGV